MIAIDSREFQNGLKRFKSAMIVLVNATRQQCKTLVRKHTVSMKSLTVKNAPRAFGVLRKGVTMTLENEGLTGTVRTGAPYAQWVEGQAVWTALGSGTGLIGRRPGKWPPEAPIRAWVKLKGLPRKWGVSENSATFLVRRKIGRRGTDAQPHLAPAFAATAPKFESELGDVLKRAGEEAARVGSLTGIA